MPDGGNVVKGYNYIEEIEFSFTRTGVGQADGFEGFIPVWAPMRNAIDDFHYGDWGHGLMNVAFGISDVFLVRAAVGVVAKVGVSLSP